MTSNTFTSAIGQVATHMIGQVATMRPGGGGSMPLEEGNVAQLEEQNFKFLVQEWKAKLNIEQLNPDDLESVKAEFAQALLELVQPPSGSSRPQRPKRVATATSIARTLSIWESESGVPIYKSWGESNPRGNKYSTFFIYAQVLEYIPNEQLILDWEPEVLPNNTNPPKNPQLIWDWKLEVLPNKDGSPGPTKSPSNFTVARKLFATEHIFEIQIISQFLRFTQAPSKAQKVLKDKAYTLSQNGIVEAIRMQGTCKRQSALDLLACELPRGEEFVYLQEDLNRTKMVYFMMATYFVLQSNKLNILKFQDHEIRSKVIEILNKIILTSLVAAYMNNHLVQKIYLKVRDRVHKVLETLDRKGNAEYKANIRPLNLGAKWKSFHPSFISLIQTNMQRSIDNGFAAIRDVLAQVKTRNHQPTQSNSNRPHRQILAETAKKEQGKKLEEWLEDVIGQMDAKRLSNHLDNINIRGLMVRIDEKPPSAAGLNLDNPPMKPVPNNTGRGPDTSLDEEDTSMRAALGDLSIQGDPDDSELAPLSLDELRGKKPTAGEGSRGGGRGAPRGGGRGAPRGGALGGGSSLGRGR